MQRVNSQMVLMCLITIGLCRGWFRCAIELCQDSCNVAQEVGRLN